MRTFIILNGALCILLTFTACDRHSADEVYVAFGKGHSAQKHANAPHAKKEPKADDGLNSVADREKGVPRPLPTPPRFFPQQ